MRIRDSHIEHDEPVNLLSLIDTLFFLLMFFLVATQFKEEERAMGIQLPGLSSSQPLSAVPQQLIINVREDGQLVVHGKVCDQRDLGALLGGVARGEGAREVLIRADERSLHRYFAGIAALCRRMGIGEVNIGYVVEEPKPMPIE
jgi:biopolymer transport protein ExbD